MYNFIIYCFITINQVSNKYLSQLYNYSNVYNNYDGNNGYVDKIENDTVENKYTIKEKYYKNILLQKLLNNDNSINEKIILINLNKEKKYMVYVKIKDLFDDWNSID